MPNGTTPLIAASRGGHLDVAKLLIGTKADLARTHDSGETALDIAMRFNNTDIAELIQKAGGKSGKSVTIEVQ